MRTHRLIGRTDEYEIYEITWPPGTGLDWHTHGASRAMVVVIEGELSEWIRTAPMPVEMHARGSQAVKLVHQSGTSFFREPYTAHKVVNNGRTPAKSVHTYCPPLSLKYSEDLEIY